MEDPQRPRDSFSLGAWLLAELMLGLAMLFFAANTLGFASGAPDATPTPRPDWEATIVAQQTMQADVEATATAAALDDDSGTATMLQTTLTALATSQVEVEATADAYATQAARPTATSQPTSTPLPSPTLPPPTATPLPTSTPAPTPTPPPDVQATRVRDLEDELTRVAAIPTATVAPTATPADTCIETVNLKEVELTVPVTAWAGASAEERIKVLQQTFADYRGQRVGLSLTFGHDLDPTESERRAKEANELLPTALPDMFDTNSKYKEYTDRTGAEPSVAVSFGVYFINDPCA